jgi:beta-lactamase regulating signal transducer with metallopeptidase domain
MIPVLVEAALRALLVAVTVWAGLHICRVSNVLAQKIAWALVLASAVAMPLVMRWHILSSSMALNVPVMRWNIHSALPMRDALLPGSHVDNPVSTQSVLPPDANRPPAHLASTPSPSSPASSSLDGSRANRFPAPVISRTEFDTSAGARIAVAPSVTTESADARTPANPSLSSSAFRRAGEWAAASGLLGWGAWAAFLYLGVVLVLMIRMVYGVSQAFLLWHSAEPFVPMAIPDASLDRATGPEIRFNARIASPVTIGSGILLPAECLDWDTEKLRIVLAHESAHVRQMDFYLQLLASLYAAAFWFSPLGWWLRHKLSDLGEAISDRAGLEEAASRASYAQLLLEFAAMPRPTAPAVAMARTSNLSHRIERLLNETNFRQAFAGSRARLLLAVLLVPAASLAATTLIRVQAAPTAQAAPAPAPAVAVMMADPEPMPVQDPVPRPLPDVVVPVAPVAPVAPIVPVRPVTALDGSDGEIQNAAENRDVTISSRQDSSASIGSRSSTMTVGDGKSGTVRYYSADSDEGDSWAIVRGGREHVTFSGEWNDQTKGSIDRARTLAKGQQFLWFMRDSKPYIVDDPAVIARIDAMYKPIEDLGRQQEVLGKQQEELGRQQEELGRRQEQANIPTPDISKEMAQLNEAVAKLNAQKGGTVSQEQLADIEGKLGDLQGRVGALQGEVGAKQGELGAEQGRLGEMQGKLGEQQGRLGAQQGKLAEEASRKVRSIIDQSLHEGKAQPVD